MENVVDVQLEVDETVQDMLKCRCGRKRSSIKQSRRYVTLFDVDVGSVLWQKVNNLNMYGLKEV